MMRPNSLSYLPDPPTLRVKVPGDILSSNVESIEGIISEAIERGNPFMVLDLVELDLRNATAIDSAGIKFISNFLIYTIARGGRVRAVISNLSIFKVVQLMHLDRHLDLVAVVSSAAAQALPFLPTCP